MAVTNHILFAQTQLVPLIATTIKHIYQGDRDDIGSSPTVRPFIPVNTKHLYNNCTILDQRQGLHFGLPDHF